MATFGEQVVKGLMNPSFGKGLFDLGSAIGSAPRRAREEAERKAKEEQLKSIMQMNAAAATTGDPTNLARVAQQLSQIPGMEQQAMEAAKLAREASETMQKKETTAKTERGKGELMALANDPTFDLDNPQMRVGYIGMADSFGVSRSDAIQIALDARKERQGGDKQTFASAGRYKDRDGNIYTATEVRTKGGGVKIDYSPITPNAPENPVGELTPIGGAYSETADERLGRGVEAASEETKAEQFSTLQVEAAANLPNIEIAIGNAERSLELLKQIRTGGFTTAVVRSAQQVIGTEPKSQAEFNLLAGKTVLDNLSKFRGAISEGERLYLERLYQSLERSGGANQAILENLLQEAQFLLADAKAKANASSYSDYLETRPTFSSVTSTDKATNKINFEDMKL